MTWIVFRFSTSRAEKNPLAVYEETVRMYSSRAALWRMGLSVRRRSFSGSAFQHGARISRRKGDRQMKQFKDLNASIAHLRAVLARGDVEPEQKQNVEHAIEQLKRLRRKPHCKAADFYRCVREVTEQLLRAFIVQ